VADAYYAYGLSLSGGTAPDYYVVYVNGNLTLNGGTYGGKATVFVTGNVTISGTMTYANSSSQIVVICLGSLNCGYYTPTAVGTYYVGGALNVTDTFTISRGSITAGSIYMTDRLACTFDPYFKNNPSQKAALKLPGFWP
jgi:hypothetical protein